MNTFPISKNNSNQSVTSNVEKEVNETRKFSNCRKVIIHFCFSGLFVYKQAFTYICCSQNNLYVYIHTFLILIYVDYQDIKECSQELFLTYFYAEYGENRFVPKINTVSLN